MSELKKLASILASMNSADEIHGLLNEIMTDSERKDLALRWKLMEMLSAGQTQRDIARDLRISLCKITRGAKILKAPHSISKKLILKKQERKNEY